jgi:hypothetical protein
MTRTRSRPSSLFDEDELQLGLFDARQDVIRLVRGGLERDVETYVLVNNKAEGSSPWTIQALARQLAG